MRMLLLNLLLFAVPGALVAQPGTLPPGGPYLFVAEQLDRDLESGPILGTPDAATFVPPAAGEVVHGFEPQHWNVVQMLLADPDGRVVSVEAPLPDGVEAPAGHH